MLSEHMQMQHQYAYIQKCTSTPTNKKYKKIKNEIKKKKNTCTRTCCGTQLQSYIHTQIHSLPMYNANLHTIFTISLVVADPC